MKISDLSAQQLAKRLRSNGLYFKTGPFTVHLKTSFDSVIRECGRLYADYPLVEEGFADFHMRIVHANGLRRYHRPQVFFYFDDEQPFKPLPASQAYPMFEWALNWCVANHMHYYFIIHSAVIEKNGKAVIMPAPPGSGKSTLCAALVSRGWRLLSDELALIDMKTGLLIPNVRPVSLKNKSIEIMKAYAPQAVFSASAFDTNKGTVAHMKASAESVARGSETARPGWVIFPKYIADAPPLLNPLTKATTYMQVAENGFNYSRLGKQGFSTLVNLIDASDCYEFSYSKLDDALAVFDKLSDHV